MQKLKKTIRKMVLILFLVLAAAAGGMAGVPPPRSKDPHDFLPRIEMIDQKEEDEEKDLEQVKK